MTDQISLADLERGTPFADRHIGIADAADQQRMLDALGYASLEDMLADAVPASIREKLALALPPAVTEAEAAAELRALADRNQVLTSMIGLGYYGTITPAVIRRNVLENPAWYTAYTPYQPEISQGRLEALLNFQTMVEDLTGLPVVGRVGARRGHRGRRGDGARAPRRQDRDSTFVVDADVLPQTLDVIRTRANPLGVDVVVHDLSQPLPAEGVFGVLAQYPGASGAVRDLAPVVEAAHARGALVVVAADLLALTLLKTPGEFGADVAVGTTQRFGVPLGFGGPHAGYLAVRAGLERQLPGRLVGVSLDADGAPAYRLALQTREQHIRREKATSNICTAQVLLAVIASMYAVYHGPDGLRSIAGRVHRFASILAAGLREAGVDVARRAVLRHRHRSRSRTRSRVSSLLRARPGSTSGRSTRTPSASACDEATRREHVVAVWGAFGASLGLPDVERLDVARRGRRSRRSTDFLTHPVFGTHHSETAMLRYLRTLADRDYALDRGMIPLGSCTMKLNATTEMEPVTNPGFADIHPFAPQDQFDGYTALFDDLRVLAGRDHRLRRRVAAAQRRFAGRVRGAAGDPQLPRGERARASRRLPHPRQRARHQRCQRGDGRDARRRGQDRRRASARSTWTTCAPRSPSTPTAWPRSWSPTRPRTACSRSTSPRCAPWSTTPAGRSTSTAPTSTRWSGWPVRDGSARTSRT